MKQLSNFWYVPCSQEDCERVVAFLEGCGYPVFEHLLRDRIMKHYTYLVYDETGGILEVARCTIDFLDVDLQNCIQNYLSFDSIDELIEYHLEN